MAFWLTMDTTASAEAVEECGKNVCMQVAALKPQFTNRNEVSAEHIAHEKEILLAQIMNDPKEISENQLRLSWYRNRSYQQRN